MTFERMEYKGKWPETLEEFSEVSRSLSVQLKAWAWSKHVIHGVTVAGDWMRKKAHAHSPLAAMEILWDNYNPEDFIVYYDGRHDRFHIQTYDPSEPPARGYDA